MPRAAREGICAHGFARVPKSELIAKLWVGGARIPLAFDDFHLVGIRCELNSLQRTFLLHPRAATYRRLLQAIRRYQAVIYGGTR